MVEQVLAKTGRIDILVNNAGIAGKAAPVWDQSDEDWQSVIDINLTGVFQCCRAVIGHMRDRDYGRIVNIASVAGLIGMPQHFAYCAAKAGVIHFTKSLALDHGPENIRINCICPGGVLTPMLGEVIDVNNAAQVDRVARQHALGRIADPQEIARVSLFLCSSDASFMTGAAVTVDGGIAAGRMGHIHAR
jgi:3-oxoacyl-[acyl-carrier protein] reductase